MQTEGLKELRKEVEANRGSLVVPPELSGSQARNVTSLDGRQEASLHSDIKSNDGFNLLGTLLETAFFYGLFEFIADRQFTAKTRQLRVAKMRNMHPRIYRWSIRADFLVRVAVVLAIVAAGMYSVWKVLS